MCGERPAISGSRDAHWYDVVGTRLDSMMSRVLPGQTSSSPGVQVSMEWDWSSGVEDGAPPATAHSPALFPPLAAQPQAGSSTPRLSGREVLRALAWKHPGLPCPLIRCSEEQQ